MFFYTGPDYLNDLLSFPEPVYLQKVYAYFK